MEDFDFFDDRYDNPWPINPIAQAIAMESLVLTEIQSSRCVCRGSGYWLSDFDTWEQCRFHWDKNKVHPEF